MRKIKFRGKRLDNGEWVYGDLIHDRFDLVFIQFIVGSVREKVRVIPETVGQYTEVHDKNGQEIWKDDICSFYCNGIKRTEEVYFCDGTFFLGTCMALYQSKIDQYKETGDSLEVIGNIYD